MEIVAIKLPEKIRNDYNRTALIKNNLWSEPPNQVDS